MVVRRSGAPLVAVVLLFPEKRGNEPSGTTPATATETLREWVTSRGSPALAEWCLAEGLRTLRELAELRQSDAEGAVRPVPELSEETCRELNRLSELLRRFG